MHKNTGVKSRLKIPLGKLHWKIILKKILKRRFLVVCNEFIRISKGVSGKVVVNKVKNFLAHPTRGIP